MTEQESLSRPQFGGRVLSAGEDVFKHNAWDNFQWGEEQEREAREQVEKSSSCRLGEEEAGQLEERAAEHWDKFYSIHQNRFFKERNWLFTEFPNLAPDFQGARQRVFPEGDTNVTSDDILPNTMSTPHSEKHDNTGDVSDLRKNEEYFGSNSSFRLFEIGCGTGSTVFPILEVNSNPGLMIYSCDLSAQAVQLVKEHPEYSKGRCFSMVCDVTKEDDWKCAPFPPSSLDVVSLIFVLSAISPAKMSNVISNIFNFLKPGGEVIFRDYGRYDMAQLRFKQGKCIEDNFYARGDGTRCYFFSQEELRDMFLQEGFIETQNLVDRRLQVNRGKKLKMYRVWIQAKYKKPF